MVGGAEAVECGLGAADDASLPPLLGGAACMAGPEMRIDTGLGDVGAEGGDTTIAVAMGNAGDSERTPSVKPAEVGALPAPGPVVAAVDVDARDINRSGRLSADVYGQWTRTALKVRWPAAGAIKFSGKQK